MYKTVTPVVLLISCLLYQVHSLCSPVCGDNGVCDTSDDTCLCRQNWFTTAPLTPCDTEGIPATCNVGGPCDADKLCDALDTCDTDCTSANCQNGQICLALSDGTDTRCHCDIGFTGTNCVDCATDDVCNTKGTCDITTGDCTCAAPITDGGKYCECLLVDTEYDSATETCWCKSGFGGADCKTECDASCTAGCTAVATAGCIVPTTCPLSPCQGGTCTSYQDATASVKCRCNAGVVGEYCDKCASAVGCNSAGTCDTTTGVCACTADYDGPFCDKCKTAAGCSSKGTCDTATGTCTCDSTNVGTNCQHACPAECPTSCTLKADGTGAECSGSGAVMVMTSLATIVMAVLGPFL